VIAVDEWTRERYPGVTVRDLERERRARPPLRRHVFVPSGQRSYGHRICTCGSLERDSVHRVSEASEEVRAVEARKVERVDQ